jgi:site-specific recombinase XerD
MNIDQLIEEYVSYKQSLGMQFHSPAVKLRALAKAVGHVEIREVSADAVRGFLDRSRTNSDWFTKYNAVAPFFRSVRSRGYTTANVLPLSLPKQEEKFRPYIFSLRDMQELLRVVDNRHRGSWHMEPFTARVLLLLLYGTGLRISEALRLQHRDVDLNEAILTIRETKFFKSRLVPVGAELAEVLRTYYQRKWGAEICGPDLPFLATYDGRAVTRQTAELTYRRLRDEAAVSRNDEATFQPRLHDFRHTFAVTRLVSWYREGKDVQRLLPHLSTYLGHVRIQETARYLTMTTELLEEASSRFERYSAGGSQ